MGYEAARDEEKRDLKGPSPFITHGQVVFLLCQKDAMISMNMP